jgi:hypothetical protein
MSNFIFTYTYRTNPHWARLVGYGPFSLCVIHKEGLCPSSRDIKRLIMISNINIYGIYFKNYQEAWYVNNGANKLI